MKTMPGPLSTIQNGEITSHHRLDGMLWRSAYPAQRDLLAQKLGAWSQDLDQAWHHSDARDVLTGDQR